ncbi:MAG: hypothetical protein A3F72_10700 [Bacteroidetes bacterium RIFCSPLOWO2_12_FULL_35_15]|nr:MAG: hypothetical protein A3F72_10700 [Bacteroidetes bacterium RIFCSPLOWO2_12_FULL_35_15]
MSKSAANITCGIYLYNTKNKKILVCHATNSPWNKWSIPKGLKDEGEDSYIAACRELKEETGIDIRNLHILQTLSLPAIKYKRQNKILESYLIFTDSDLDNFSFNCKMLVNDEFPEVDGWKWISLSKMKDYLHESQQKNFEEINTLIPL